MVLDPSRSRGNQQQQHQQQQVHHPHNQHQQHQHQQQPHRRSHQHQHQHPNQSPHDEEVHEELVSLPYRKAYEMAEKFATTRIGQYTIGRGDRLLKTIETTAKWSLPPDQMEEKLQRPLSWLPFLMVIVTLRLMRIWISIAAILIGNGPIGAQDVVYFIQTRRRKLRALRLHGVKEICRRETEVMARKPGYGDNSFMAQLKKFFSTAICRPGLRRDSERRIMIHRGNEVETVGNDHPEAKASKRPRDDDHDLTVDEMLNKYASEKSDDDSDFVPNPNDESYDNSKTSTTSSDSSDEGEADLCEEDQEPSINHPNEHHHSDHRRNRLIKTSTINDSVEFEENGNEEPLTMPVPIQDIKQENNAEHEAKKPYENGPSNGVENREVDVAYNFVLTPPGVQNHKEKNLKPNEDAETSYKSTPGHKSAAAMRTLLKTTNYATFDAAKIVPEATEPEFENDIEIYSQEITSTSNNDSSPTLSAASSTSSLASFIAKENSILKSETYVTASSESALIPETEDSNNLESTRLASISSSEDDFYSPMGSPPDFNDFQQQQQQQEQLNSKFHNSPHPKCQSHLAQKPINESHSEENPSLDNITIRGPMGQNSRNGQQHKYNGNGQPQSQRFRGRNRR